MRRDASRLGRRVRLTGLGLALVVLVFLAAPAYARAGTWTLVSCTQPNGQPAPTDGWTTAQYGGPAAPYSGDANTCAQGGALTAVSSTSGQPASYTGPEWIFTAPPQSTILGGTVRATLTSPRGQTWIGTPQVTYDAADVIANCQLNEPCGQNGTLSGSFPISHPGGTSIYAPALCVHFQSPTCPLVGGGTVNAEIDIHAADIELSSQATPVASGFSGPLLTAGAHGVADLLFTASDAGGAGTYGPGVYSVTVQIDGRTVYGGVPDSNGGQCSAVGTDPSDGALMFDHMQPCRATESVDLPINIARFTTGKHHLKVIVVDAAGNSSVVLDRIISTSKLATTPLPRNPNQVRGRFTIAWRWFGRRTVLEAITAHNPPGSARVAASCQGRGCPGFTVRSVRTTGIARLLRALTHRTFHAGDRLFLTVTATHRLPERIEVVIRNGRLPLARLI